MAEGFFKRLFGIGEMPEQIRKEIAGEQVLFEVTGVRVSLHRSGRVPGTVVMGG
jgi:hypothetical protein